MTGRRYPALPMAQDSPAAINRKPGWTIDCADPGHCAKGRPRAGRSRSIQGAVLHRRPSSFLLRRGAVAVL